MNTASRFCRRDAQGYFSSRAEVIPSLHAQSRSAAAFIAKHFLWVTIAAMLGLLLTACGGGGGGAAPTYTLGGTVSGLTGSVVLQNNGGENLTVSSDGSFSFNAALNGSAAYTVTILTQPAGQACSVSNGSGTVSGANVANIAVNCVSFYSVGGTVSGLVGSLVLQNNAGDNFVVSGSGSFVFDAPINNGASYAVTILTQPAGQICSVSSGSGTVSGENIANVAVDCVSLYSVGGTVSGLVGSLVLQNNGGDNLTLSASGSFVFDTAINDGAPYAVTILTEPAAQDCTVTNSTGVVDANVTNIAVQCAMGTPAVTLAYQATKTFHFTWLDVNGETEYRLLENRDGSSGFSLIATLAADSTSHNLVVPLFKRINASYILQACNASYCTDSAVVSVSGTLAGAVGHIQASNTTSADFFGHALAISGDGNTFAVGAVAEDSAATGIGGNQNDTTSGASGAVYVFARNGTTWSQQAYIKASNTEASDSFGQAVALSSDGNTLVVGAIGEDSAATGINSTQISNGASNSGAVYVFTRSGTAWSQQAYIKASNTQADDWFGYRLALGDDGNTLAVAAVAEDSAAAGINGDQASNTAVNSGAVYIFVRSATAWSQQAYVKASNPGGIVFFGYGDQFGQSLDLAGDGNTLVVGAIREDSDTLGIDGNQLSNAAEDSGAAYVFTRTGTAWSQQAYIKASNTGVGDFFGASVALNSDGNTLVVGARYEDSAATGIDGDQADNTASDSGAAYAFVRSGTTWSQQAYLKASNAGAADEFGYAVALSNDGNALVVGAIGEDSTAVGINGDQASSAAGDSGAAYAFARNTIWSQQAYIKASNTTRSDSFGYAVALSGDGDTLAAGSIGGEPTGLLFYSGEAYLY